MFSAPGALVAVLAYEKHLLQAVSTAAHDPNCGVLLCGHIHCCVF